MIIMAEENENSGVNLRKAGKIILGVIVVLAGLFLVWLWWPEFLKVAKGVIGVGVILIGIIIAALGFTD